jgi:hypothetical protein
MTENNAAKNDEDVMDEPPARFKERTDGTCRLTITAPNHKDYKIETRSNGSGGVELVLFDSEGREFIESFGTADELAELNAMAALYAKSIYEGDELGQAFVNFLDSEDVQETI